MYNYYIRPHGEGKPPRIKNKITKIMITRNSCVCPPGEALPEITVSNCPQRMGQIQKLIFMRRSSKAAFGEDAAPTKLASWTPLLTASDATKVIVTPYVNNPELTAGEPLTTGGGNASLNGAEKVNGAAAATFTGVFENMNQTTIAQLKQLRCEDMAVAFITQDGRIWMEKLDSGYNFMPILPSTYHVGSLTGGKFGEEDQNSIQFALEPDYSDKMQPVDTEFNALLDLVK